MINDQTELDNEYAITYALRPGERVYEAVRAYLAARYEVVRIQRGVVARPPTNTPADADYAEVERDRAFGKMAQAMDKSYARRSR